MAQGSFHMAQDGPNMAPRRLLETPDLRASFPLGAHRDSRSADKYGGPPARHEQGGLGRAELKKVLLAGRNAIGRGKVGLEGPRAFRKFPLDTLTRGLQEGPRRHQKTTKHKTCFENVSGTIFGPMLGGKIQQKSIKNGFEKRLKKKGQ